LTVAGIWVAAKSSSGADEVEKERGREEREDRRPGRSVFERERERELKKKKFVN